MELSCYRCLKSGLTSEELCCEPEIKWIFNGSTSKEPLLYNWYGKCVVFSNLKRSSAQELVGGKFGFYSFYYSNNSNYKTNNNNKTTTTKLGYPCKGSLFITSTVNVYWLYLTCVKYRCNRQALRYFEFLSEAEKKTFIRNNRLCTT